MRRRRARRARSPSHRPRARAWTNVERSWEHYPSGAAPGGSGVRRSPARDDAGVTGLEPVSVTSGREPLPAAVDRLKIGKAAEEQNWLRA